MIYMAADNDDMDLKASYYGILNQLEGIGSSDDVKVLLLYDGIGKNPSGDEDSHVYYIRKGVGTSMEVPLSNINSTWRKEVNTGDPGTLVSFAKYALSHYPSTHSALVIGGEHQLTTLSLDLTGEGDSLTLSELRDSLAIIEDENHGSNLDLLVFRGYLTATTANIEWCYQVMPFVDHVVCSETKSVPKYWHMDNWIDALGKDPEMDGEGLGRFIVSDYMDQTHPDWDKDESSTASLIDLGKLPILVKTFDDLARRSSYQICTQFYRGCRWIQPDRHVPLRSEPGEFGHR